MNQHPNDAELALYAGGDQGWFSRRLTNRHIKQCEACQAAIVEFSDLRPAAEAFPPVPWNRLASEMTANISLGLAAGECVSMRPAGRVRHIWSVAPGSWRRLAAATAILCAFGGVGYVVQHPPSGGMFSSFGSNSAGSASTVLEASDSGLQIRDGGQTLRLLNTSGKGVTHSVGARGEVGARYLDSNGYVTISQVYGQ
jgi:hypothetical protein